MSIGFKEWSLVCRALGSGAQSIILRKGGIHEGRQGFWWRHDDFFLFPTHFHEQSAQFPWQPPADEPGNSPDPALAAAPAPESHTVTLRAEVVEKHQITDWSVVERLAPFHFWTPETIRERFDWSESAGISAAILRVHNLSAPWTFPDQPSFGGCRSWLNLPEPPPGLSSKPVLSDEAHASRIEAIRRVISPL